jgi:putative molybdopterin biosynthesis protein
MVEDIFLYEEVGGETVTEPEPAEAISSNPLAPGQPVQLCSVGDRRVAVPIGLGTDFYPDVDGTVAASKRPDKKESPIHVLRKSDRSDLLLAGCDPASSLLANPLREAAVRLVPWIANSSSALRLLRDGHVHIAGCHIYNRKSADSNLAFVRKLFNDDEIVVVNFVTWEQGLAVVRQNPLNIRGIDDLARKDIRLANREPGSGTRRLVDDLLKAAGVPRKQVKGYNFILGGHVAAARAVQDGRADCCFGVSSAARLLGLDFIPIVSERYDLAISRKLLNEKPVQVFLDTLNRSTLRHVLETACGYDASATGKIMLG